jgi:hypothetical protein
VARKAEAVALEREGVDVRPAVMNRHAPGVGSAAASHVLAARPRGDGEDLAAVVNDVVERGLDLVRCSVEFGGL